jgi:monoamine oxidase
VPDLKGDATPDLIVIGSGLGGLCAGALAARHGLAVLVLEAHDRPGGAAHGFTRRGFHFESGPSLWSGLGRWPSTNPWPRCCGPSGRACRWSRTATGACCCPRGT